MPNYAIFEPTPNSVKPLIPYIEGKTVYELGAGDGTWAKRMSEFAKVVAVEKDDLYAAECRMRGLSVMQADLTDISFSQADVLYFFLSFSGAYRITRKIIEQGWHGTVISCFYPLHEVPGKYWEPTEVLHDNLPFLIYKV